MSLNVAECVVLPARQFPTSDAIVFENTTLSFGVLLDRVRQVAAFLVRAGLCRGDRVAILLPNTPHFPIVYYGILYAGGVAVPLNPLQTGREFKYLFGDAEPRLVFAWSDVLEPVTAALEGLSSPPALVVVESGSKPFQGNPGYSFLTEMARGDSPPAMAETNPDDVAVIMYTAAYYGRPMGAQLTHFNTYENAQTVGSRMLHLTPEDRSLGVLPLFHSFGQCVIMNAALLAGASVVLVARFDATRVLETITRERLTVMGLVPTMYHLLLGAKTHGKPDLASLRHVLVGGATMPPELFATFQERFGVTILEGYGLTETSPVVSFNMSVEANRPGSVGVPLWGCEVRIVDENGAPLPPGGVGEILVRGHNVMKGYLNQPEINAGTIQEGWLRTGDWGTLDEDGYIYLKGLKKDMLIRAGLNVYPREVELVLEDHPDVDEAAVVGVSDPVRGTEARACIVARSPYDALEKNLKRYCRENLAGYKCPRYFTFVESLPHKADGSLDKTALQQQQSGS